MAAGIGKDAYLVVLGPHHDEVNAKEFHAVEIADIGDDLLALQQVPGGMEDLFHLGAVEALRGVAPERQPAHLAANAAHGGVMMRREEILRLVIAEIGAV